MPAASSAAVPTPPPGACTAWGPRSSTPCPPGWTSRSARGHEWAKSFRRGVPGEFDGEGPAAGFTPAPGLRKVRRVARTVTGTRTRFWPDPQVFVPGAEWSYSALAERARQTAYLVPGLTIRIRDERARAERLHVAGDGPETGPAS